MESNFEIGLVKTSSLKASPNNDLIGQFLNSRGFPKYSKNIKRPEQRGKPKESTRPRTAILRVFPVCS